MSSARVGDGLLNGGAADQTGAAAPAPRTLTEPGALLASPVPQNEGNHGRSLPASAGSAPGSVNAAQRLHQQITANCCPISGLTDTELADHARNITNTVIAVKGWDKIRAEYGDVRAQARQRAKRPCLVCDRPTSALSQVCTRPDCVLRNEHGA